MKTGEKKFRFFKKKFKVFVNLCYSTFYAKPAWAICPKSLAINDLR